MNVRHRLNEQSASDEKLCTYETVICPACLQLHFIEIKTRAITSQVVIEIADLMKSTWTNGWLHVNCRAIAHSRKPPVA